MNGFVDEEPRDGLIPKNAAVEHQDVVHDLLLVVE
jgi:hypothetical protein